MDHSAQDTEYSANDELSLHILIPTCTEYGMHDTAHSATHITSRWYTTPHDTPADHEA